MLSREHFQFFEALDRVFQECFQGMAEDFDCGLTIDEEMIIITHPETCEKATQVDFENEVDTSVDDDLQNHPIAEMKDAAPSFNPMSNEERIFNDYELDLNNLIARFERLIEELKINEPLSPLNDPESVELLNNLSDSFTKIVSDTHQNIKSDSDKLAHLYDIISRERETDDCIEASRLCIKISNKLKQMINRILMLISDERIAKVDELNAMDKLKDPSINKEEIANRMLFELHQAELEMAKNMLSKFVGLDSRKIYNVIVANYHESSYSPKSVSSEPASPQHASAENSMQIENQENNAENNLLSPKSNVLHLPRLMIPEDKLNTSIGSAKSSWSSNDRSVIRQPAVPRASANPFSKFAFKQSEVATLSQEGEATLTKKI